MMLVVLLFAAADKYGILTMIYFMKRQFIKAWAAFKKHIKDTGTAWDDEHDNVGRMLIDITRTIYSGTPSTERGLRDAILRKVVASTTRSWLVSSSLRQLLVDEPDITLDLATHRLSEDQWKCADCGTITPILVTWCSCNPGLWDCKKPECEKETASRNHCNKCFASIRFKRTGLPATST